MEPARRPPRAALRTTRVVAVTLAGIFVAGCVGQRPSFIDDTPTTLSTPQTEPTDDPED